MVVPSVALLLLLGLPLLWVVVGPPGPHWRTWLGVAILDSGLDREVLLLDARLGGGMVILSSWLLENEELDSKLDSGMVVLSPRQLEGTTGSSVLFLLLGSGEGLGLTRMVRPFMWAFIVLRIRYVPINLLYFFCVRDS